MCQRPHTKVIALPFSWEWLPSVHDGWKPLDEPTSRQIEAAFQGAQAKVALTEGAHFAAHPRTYEVVFDRAGGKHVQVNRSSGMRRDVRRLADDDTAMFVPVQALAAEDVCPICQEALVRVAQAVAGAGAGAGAVVVVLDDDDEEVEDNGEPVRLSVCSHVFHRKCIASQIKLKGKCPLCAKAV